jgi:predicted PurR-regulated permease PerM
MNLFNEIAAVFAVIALYLFFTTHPLSTIYKSRLTAIPKWVAIALCVVLFLADLAYIFYCCFHIGYCVGYTHGA